jgi:hypothetical protein
MSHTDFWSVSDQDLTGVSDLRAEELNELSRGELKKRNFMHAKSKSSSETTHVIEFWLAGWSRSPGAPTKASLSCVSYSASCDAVGS